MPIQLQHYASSVASHRVLLYTALSIAAVLAVVANALKRHSNFYSVAVYLSKSNGTVVVIANFGLLLALLAGRLLQQVFFGPLRPMEVERLYDRMWFFVTESLLAFTIFRDEFDIPFALMFGLLLFTKCFHWLLSDRIEWMDQRPYPGPPLLFHIRIHALVGLLWATDLVVFLLTVENMLTHGVGGTVLFASEYAILLAGLGNSVAKYVIALIDLRRASLRGGENAPPWEDKSMLVFYVELATDFLKLVTYMAFFMIVLTFYGLPLNIVRDVYITARSFIMRFRDLIRYRTATRNMDERYPNATEEELSNMNDRTCIICREEMVHPTVTPQPEAAGEQAQTPSVQDGPNTTPKKLPCGHIFHFYCLRSWLERQQSCPTCRRSVLETNQPTQANGQPVPPRVQPGVVPQAPNAMGPGQPFQWQPDQQANRGGILGRLMGGAGLPPFAHGQFPPIPPAGQVQQPNGYAAVQQGFQPVFGQPAVPYPRPLAAQGERFAGFFAPDGVWHPWPQVPGDANNEAPNVQRNEPPESTQTITVRPDPENGAELAPNAGQESSVGASTAQSTSPAASPQSNAREAAAAAALRRLNPLGSSPPIRRGSITPIDRMPTQSGTQAPNGSASESAPSSSIPAATSIPSSTSPGSNNSARTQTAPTLIPLYDPQISSFSLPRFRSSSERVAGRAARIGLERFTGLGMRQSVQELPLTVTEEQLRVLDQLTREAIDERLRILENIQTTTAHIAMDLLRCRSVLPRSSSSSTFPTPSSSTQNAQNSAAEGAQNSSGGTSSTAERAPTEEGSGNSEAQPPQPIETGA
ncbi:uncharacterized protein FOMMEDRAFT_123168 [Fomitiporia mediterranea MF3/22]|uniref:uncharacterized protein n=1 Tax=Fomitiporia mediterranea (strain MF3/22) TaxID=694068 RepID=UPI00044093DA|nr:uncharacterized protein FOMMEDRAFT_123168 [Fomitiporia mediterranea MF3/22]EJD03016.1 hypothetical protein FOMMEDRAFT_123168 [Fomitiporia mediterranea MF3/22]